MSLWCVVVTYNRPDAAKTCVDALLSQTHLPDWVLIVENSDDAEMARIYAAEPKVEVIRPAGGNIGGSACFALGMQTAFERGASEVVLAADDFTPDPTMIDELLKASGTESRPAVFVAVTYDPNDHELAPPLNVGRPEGLSGYPLCRNRRPWQTPRHLREHRILRTLEDLHTFAAEERVSMLEVPAAGFHGMLILRPVFEKIGVPRPDFFIYSDDSEYSLRAQRHKIPLLAVPLAGGQHGHTWIDKYFTVGPLRFLSPSGLRENMAYYAIRNYLWVARLYYTGIGQTLRIARGLSWALRIVAFGRGPASVRLRTQIRAVADGLFRDPSGRAYSGAAAQKITTISGSSLAVQSPQPTDASEAR